MPGVRDGGRTDVLYRWACASPSGGVRPDKGETEIRIRLAYGTTGLEVDLPDARTRVIRPRHAPRHQDPATALREALRHPIASRPLRELARPGQRVAISVCDITRPQPRREMLGAILAELDGIIAAKDVTILIAAGTHRAPTEPELEEMFGTEIRRAWRIVNHDSRVAADLVDLGAVDDVPVLLNRHWVEADLRITTGFVEPHFFAGFSGGPKMIAPGLAGLATTLALHDARRIGDPGARWGVCVGNPVHDSIRAVAALANADFAVDVLLNDEQEITQAFGGALFEMHERARDASRSEAMVPVDAPFEIVVTTNSGYPLDQNLYQAVKGMAAASEIVREHGTIICAAECRDGVPEGSAYADLLALGDSPAALLRAIEASNVTVPDQWQVQIQARVQQRARVLVHSAGVDAERLRRAHLEAVEDVGATVRAMLEADAEARVCVLPEGPQTIAYLS
jgi:nickel-dependent lactate racemase